MGALLLAAAAVPLVFLLLLWKYSYWYRRGVPQGNPLKLFGDLNDSSITMTPYKKYHLSIARKFAKKPFCGVYSVGSPILFVSDEAMLKDILIKKFDSFGKVGFETTEEMDAIRSRDPFFLPIGDRWKEMRTLFSSLMTPGRVRTMISDMTSVANETVVHLKQQKHESGKGDGINVEDVAWRAVSGLLIRLIVSLDAGVFKEGTNPFLDAGDSIYPHWITEYITTKFMNLSPKLALLLGIRIYPQSVVDFYTNIIQDQQKYRKTNGVIRNDILDIITKKNSTPKIQKNTNSLQEAIDGRDPAELDVLAVFFMFNTDGVSSTSKNIAAALAELARHPEIQETLRQQILSECPLGNDITEDVINDIPLLHNVLLETNRLYPPDTVLQRIVTKPVTLKAKTGEKITLGKGEMVHVTVLANHRDPETFPDPDKFDPDRFADENLKRLVLSFGSGPRQCPGQRLATQASKIMIATILREFNLELAPQTEMPLESEDIPSMEDVSLRFVSSA